MKPHPLLLLPLFSGCSLVFGVLSHRNTCEQSTCTVNDAGQDVSLFCSNGQIIKINCGENTCDAGTGECSSRCGDGFLQPEGGEVCDFADPTNATPCNQSCRELPSCGDGELEPPEQCDDSNEIAGDGCDECRLEFIDEVEPNDDGTADRLGGLAGNDFSAANAQGPFTHDALIRFVDNIPGDEEVFAITNDSSEEAEVRLDTYIEDPGFGEQIVGGFGVPCLFAVGTLNLRREDGSLEAQNESRGANDLCSGLSFNLAAGETRYAHIVSSFEDIGMRNGSALLHIAFRREPSPCGTGIVGSLADCDRPGTAFCSLDCHHVPICGDSFIDLKNHESCDDGNLLDGDGCDSSCHLDGDGFQREVEPNDSLGLANGPITQDTLITAEFDSVDDKDSFAIRNTTGQVMVVTVDTFNPALGLDRACIIDPDTTLSFFDSDVAPSAQHQLFFNTTRSLSGDPFVLRPRDVCAGVVLFLNPGQTIFAQVSLFNLADPLPYLLQIKFRPLLCGDGIVDPLEGCDDGNTNNGDSCPSDCQPVISLMESERNDDGVPDTEFSDNDFSAINADGPITQNTLILGGLGDFVEGISRDDDFFRIDNGQGAPVVVTIKTIDPRANTGGECFLRDQTVLLDAQGNRVSSPSSDGCQERTRTLLPGESIFVGIGAEPFGLGYYWLSVFFRPVSCGDGIVDLPVETCDDAGLVGGDGCDGSCRVESGFACGGAPSACHALICGDGLVDLPESCDDGNSLDGDGCPADCAPFFLLDESEPNDDGSVSVSSGSSGGDFSIANADGPITQSTIVRASLAPIGDEDIFAITNTSAALVSVRLDTFDAAIGLDLSCGFFDDGAIDTVINIRNTLGIPVASNDERAFSIDSCSGLDIALNPGETVYAQILIFNENTVAPGYLLKAVFTPVVCGDGIVASQEACDDGNTNSGDGCDGSCAIEGGFICLGAPSACHALACGDGFVDLPESCDDGNLVAGDGCSSICQIEGQGFDCLAGQTLLVLSAANVSVAIPDNSSAGASSIINVADNRTIKKVVVRLDSVTHTFDGDLHIFLSSPSGVSVSLSGGRGAGGDNYTNTVFDDLCSTPIANGAPPFTGCFVPDAPLNVLNNQGATGDWKLTLVDTFNGDTGTLNTWSLGLCVQ